MSVAQRVPVPQPSATPNSPVIARATAGEAYKKSESSRLLCAAAYLSAAFRKQAIKRYIHETHKALAPSFGIDLATVVQHCLIAESKLKQREWWLLPPALLTFYIWLLNAGASNVTLEQALDYQIAVAIAVLCSFAICLWYEWRAYAIVSRNFVRGKFDPDALLESEDPRIGQIKTSESGNVLIYSGFTPFVGSGLGMGGWSFALDLRKPRDADLPAPPKSLTSTVANVVGPIHVEDLYARISRDLAGLQLERVSIEDKLYVNGRDVRDDQRFLKHPLARPQNRVGAEVVEAAMLQSEERLRHYRCIRVVDWSGELVLSIFLRLTKLSHNLFVEASYFLLTPVANKYRKIDSMPASLTLRRFLWMVVKAGFLSPFLMLFSPFLLFGRAQNRFAAWLHNREERKAILDNPSFDYGADFSLRDWASSGEYRRYFQKLDKEMYFKVLEKNILDSILTFLEEQNVDVSEFKQRQTTILNNGVIVSGGTMTANNLAVGEQATSTSTVTNRVTQLASFASRGTAAGKQH
jgi:hypothetical protein